MAWDKTQMRIEKAARLELTGLMTDAEIAEVIGLTPAGYAQMKTRQDYKDIRASLKTGFIRDLDADLGSDIKAIREKVRNNLPAAVQTIIDAATQRSDLRVAVSAAETLIEIDGQLAATQKVEITHTITDDQPEDVIVDSISKALQAKLAREKAASNNQSETIN